MPEKRTHMIPVDESMRYKNHRNLLLQMNKDLAQLKDNIESKRIATLESSPASDCRLDTLSEIGFLCGQVMPSDFYQVVFNVNGQCKGAALEIGR